MLFILGFIIGAVVMYILLKLSNLLCMDTQENITSHQEAMNEEVHELINEQLDFMTQVELAEILSVSTWMISLIKNNEHNIRESTYKKIIINLEKLEEL